jgi:hypothetical protein
MRNISTNILRDTETPINFIATPNSKEIFERIFILEGTKSFNLIGNYGTGKSTFLWACEKVLKDKVNLFGLDQFKSTEFDYEIIKIIGEEESLIKLLAQALSLPGRINTKRVLENLESRLTRGKKFVLFIDEFGKILEYISKNNQTSDLYLLQQIAEWINGKENEAYLVTTLHQNFTSYNQETSKQQQNEWEKVKGRYRDIVFNEPIEQLLFFASKELKKIPPPNKERVQLNEILSLVNRSKLVSYNKILSVKLIEELYPLDWLSASILVQSLQKYGQNERSLFTFVNEYSKVSIIKNSAEIYSLHKVYDYLVATLSTEINNPHNSHRIQWMTAFRCLERAELFFNENYEAASRLIKTVLLINLFSKNGGLLDDKFLVSYFKLTDGTDVTSVLNHLKKSGIIRFYSHSNKLNFLEGTDIDIEQELINAGKELNLSLNYSSLLKELVTLSIVYAKKHSFIAGTKRFFEYRVIDNIEDININHEGIDGFINVITFKIKEEQLIEASNNKPDNCFVVIDDISLIESSISKILRYDILIEKYADDINALKLLKQEKQYSLEVLEDETSKNLFSSKNKWVFNGQIIKINSSIDLHKSISKLCDEIYFKTPVFDNELVNRNVLSSPILSARKALINRLVNQSIEKNLGYPDDKFPPDKAIYISLIRETGIHIYDEHQKIYKLTQPHIDSVFKNLWNDCDKFLESALSSKISIEELYSLLRESPYKLKKGFLDFFVPLYLIAKSEDYALFFKDNTFIPFLSSETLDLIYKKSDNFFIKAYNIKGLNINLLESYKELVGITGDKPTQSTFISIYGNFLRFIRGLDKYTLNTYKLSPTAKELRNAVISSTDPETALFSSIPVALGYGDILNNTNEEKLTSFTFEIEKAIKELRSSYSELLNRIENYLVKAFNSQNIQIQLYKPEIKKQLESIDEDGLIPFQKVLLRRLTSSLDDRDSYLKSIADSIIGYPVEELKDHDESILKDRLIENAEALILAAESQIFNKSSQKTKLIQFKFYNSDGSITNEKIILKDIKQNEKHIATITEKLKELNNTQKKEILSQLYSQILKSESNE